MFFEDENLEEDDREPAEEEIARWCEAMRKRQAILFQVPELHNPYEFENSLTEAD